MERGVAIYSPITYGHYIVKEFNLDVPVEVWKSYEKAMVPAASKLLVLRWPGWEESDGVKRELELARIHNIKTEYIDP